MGSKRRLERDVVRPVRHPDVVVMDIRMPGLDAIAAIVAVPDSVKAYGVAGRRSRRRVVHRH